MTTGQLSRWIGAALLVAVVTGCRETETEQQPTQTEKPAAETRTQAEGQRQRYLDPENAPVGPGWVALFNGTDLAGWKNLTSEPITTWEAVDGVMVNAPPDRHGDNILTEGTFDDFEFYCEYLIPENGNSGVFLRGLYEVQILDDHGVPVDSPKDWGNGGIWGLQAPSENVSKPAGQWQSMHARLVGNRVTVILNGTRIIDDFELTRPTHLYEQLSDLSHGDPGPILLQGDHGPLQYRNVMIRPLGDT